MKSKLNQFRTVAKAEGVSFLILLFIAMPLKYGAGKPLAVRYVGWAHGVLFVLYILYGLRAARDNRWTLSFCAWAFIASLVPFGTFILDRRFTDSESGSVAPKA